MYSKFIPKNIQEKLKAKERALAWKESNANQSALPEGALKPVDIQSRTTFVRMCSNKVDSVTNILISGGKHNPDASTSRPSGRTMRHGLDVEGDYGSDFNTFLYQQTLRNGIRPIAGIKDINVEYKGSYKAIREATVNWTIGSLEELDELTPYFLTLGKTVVVDFGWVNPNVKSFTQMFGEGVDPFITFQNENVDFENPEADVYANFKVSQEIFTNAQVRIQKMGGDYDAIGGKVSNFEISMRTDGGFDCVTQITALGSTLFSKPIDKPTDQITAIGIGTSKDLEENKSQIVKAAGSNDNIINALVNLKSTIVRSVFRVITEDDTLPTLKYSQMKSNKSIYWDHAAENYAIALDDEFNPQVCWMNLNGRQHFFVKWGWMEDQLMNRYLSYEAGEGTSEGIKISFRSIRTAVNGDGQPILNPEDTSEEQKQQPAKKAKRKKSRDINKFYGGQMYTIVSGDTLFGIAQKYQVSQSEILELNDIENPDQISVGQEIMLPTSAVIPLQEMTQEQLQQMTSFEDDSTLYNQGGADIRNAGTYRQAKNGAEYDDYGNSIVNTSNEELIEEKTQIRNPNITLSSLPYKDRIPSQHMFKFRKESTLIRNKPSQYFMPIDMFKFWSTELMPNVDRIDGSTFKFTNSKGTNIKNWYKAWKGSSSLKREQFTVNSEQGILRNMWVNVEQIQKSFNITNADSDKPKANPPGTFETAIKNLLNALNSNFYNVWDFELAVDPYDSTNMGVMDRKVASLDTQSLKYTRYKTDVVDAEGKNVEDKEGADSHKVQNTGIYKFPSFKVGSIVKSQNLTFKIPDSMALTILYGSNKEVKGADNQNNFNNPELMRMFNSDSSIEYDDKFLKSMMTAHIKKGAGSGSAVQNIGSFKTSPNSKLVKGNEHRGLRINPETPGYKIWSGNADDEIEPQSQGNTFAKTKFVFSSDGEVIELREKTEDIPTGQTREELEPIYMSMVTDKTRGKFDVKSTSPKLYNYGKEGDGKKRTLKLKDGISKLIRSRVNGTIETEDEKELSSQLDPIIPAELTLEVDGIGGLVPGDIIHTDYIQEKYRVEIKDTEKTYGPYTYFMIKGVNQKVSSDSWTTELNTVMKLNRIPLTNSGSNLSLDREPIDQTVEEPPARPSIPVPTDDENIADEVTLDDLDFDDFEEWDAPPKPEPVTKQVQYELGIGHSIPNMDFETGTVNISQILYNAGVQRSSYYYDRDTEVVEFESPKIGGMPVRPSIPVPTDDEDIADDVKLDKLEFDTFEPWTPPPVPKKKEQQEQKEAKTMKSPKKRGEQKSTYRGHYWQNDEYLYSNEYYGKPEWRPIFEFQDGFRASFDRFPYDHPTRPSEAAVKTIREQQLYSVRKAHWDREIEGPNVKGKSVLDHDGGDRRAGSILGARYR